MTKQRFLSVVLVLFLAVILLHGTAEAAAIQGTCGDDVTWTLQGGTLTQISIPQDITAIGMEAFYGCSSLTKLAIPAGVTTLAGSAFANCSSLTSIQIPAGIAAKDLDRMYPITVGGLSISYGPISYVQRQLDKDNTRNVVTALYHYNQMANVHFK